MTSEADPEVPGAGQESADPQLEGVLARVLSLVTEDNPLSARQILSMASELQRFGVERLVEEHVHRHRRQQDLDAPLE